MFIFKSEELKLTPQRYSDLLEGLARLRRFIYDCTTGEMREDTVEFEEWALVEFGLTRFTNYKIVVQW